MSHVVVIGESLQGSARAATLTRGTSGLSATAGIHPHEAREWSDAARDRVRALLAAPEMVAVGELAAELGKPVIVHARQADADIAALLRSLQPRPPAVVLHSFSSGDAVWDAGLAINAYFSFSGMITFKNWTMQHRISECPADRLLLETDAPYLAPVPHRGRRNEPGFVREVAVRAAELRGESVASLVQRTTENARRCFGSRIDSTL